MRGQIRHLPGIRWEPVKAETETDWMAEAKCRESNPAIFFPDDGLGVIVAQKVCRECPVRPHCLDYALEHNMVHGIWGGESERGRRRILRVRRDNRRCDLL